MGVIGQRHAPAALLPPVPIVQEAGWAPEPVWTHEARGKILCPCRGSNPDRPVVQPVVRHYTAWANPAPRVSKTYLKWPSTTVKCCLSLGDAFWYEIQWMTVNDGLRRMLSGETAVQCSVSQFFWHHGPPTQNYLVHFDRTKYKLAEDTAFRSNIKVKNIMK
jgi:hypothetical protein